LSWPFFPNVFVFPVGALPVAIPDFTSGATCRYAHSASELRSAPDLQKTSETERISGTSVEHQWNISGTSVEHQWNIAKITKVGTQRARW